jgi:hypothetical protein
MKQKARELQTETVEDNHACYVLITCGQPSEDGNMNVQMTVTGDSSLAEMLLQHAQTIMEENQEDDGGFA